MIKLSATITTRLPKKARILGGWNKRSTLNSTTFTKIGAYSTSSSSSLSSSEPFYGSPRQDKDNSLSPFQNIAIAVHSATTAFLDPERHDMVAALAEVTGTIALQSLHEEMMSNPTGRRILNERPVVNTQSINISALKNLPPNTFGYHYAEFLEEHEFDPNHRAPVKYISDPELAYVMMRYRQSHDFYHVLTDLPPTIPGELALKYAELFQTGLPICALSSTVGSLKLNSHDRKIWKELYLPWAIKVGTGNATGKKWMSVYWEEEFEKDLIELRGELGVEVAPTL